MVSLQVTSQVTNFGKIHIPRNNTLYVTGTKSTIRCSEKGAITGSGTLHVNGADVLTNQIDVNRIQMDSGTLSMDDPRPVSTRMRTIRMTNGKLQFRASDAILEIDDLEIKSGTFETNRNTNIQNLQFLGGVITGEGDIKTVERFYWKSGTFSGGAQSLLNIQQYFQIDYSNVKRLRRRTFLSGVSKWVGTNLKLSIEHDFTINKGAMVMVYGDFLTLSTSTHNKGILVNNGRINCSLPLGSFNLGVDFRNYGELYLQEGSLALTQNSRIEGTIGLKENSDLVLQSGKHVFLDDISLKGNGTVTVGPRHVQAIVCLTRVWQSLLPLFCDKTFEFTIQTWQTSLDHYYVYVQIYFLSQLRKMLILLNSSYCKMCTLPTLRSRVFVCCEHYKHARSYCW